MSAVGQTDSNSGSGNGVPPVTKANNNQFLTFLMGEQEYGVDILRVQEIRGWEQTTEIPNSPVHIKGVINLRGTIVPIVDLREKFALESLEYGPLTVVIVLKVLHENGERIMGIVVDAVSDVYQIQEDEIKSPPQLGDGGSTDFIVGLADISNKMVIFLDIDGLLCTEDIPEMGDAVSQVNDHS